MDEAIEVIALERFDFVGNFRCEQSKGCQVFDDGLERLLNQRMPKILTINGVSTVTCGATA